MSFGSGVFRYYCQIFNILKQFAQKRGRKHTIYWVSRDCIGDLLWSWERLYRRFYRNYSHLVDRSVDLASSVWICIQLQALDSRASNVKQQAIHYSFKRNDKLVIVQNPLESVTINQLLRGNYLLECWHCSSAWRVLQEPDGTLWVLGSLATRCSVIKLEVVLAKLAVLGIFPMVGCSSSTVIGQGSMGNHTPLGW